MKMYVLMEDMSYDGDKFIGVYDSIKNLTNAAEAYVEKCSSAPSLYFNEVYLNGDPDNIIKQAKLTVKYTIEEYV